MTYQPKQLPSKAIGKLEIGRLPPQAPDLEDAVLGACMLESHALPIVSTILKPESFYKEVNFHIYTAIKQVAARSEPVDIMTVTEELKRIGKLQIVGGAYYITNLTSRVASAGNVEFHARIIQQKYIARELIRIGTEMTTSGYDDAADIFDIIDESKKQISEINDEAVQDKVVNTESIFDDTLNAIKNAKKVGSLGIKTPFRQINLAIFGLQVGFVYVIAARPRIGKSALMKSIILHCVLNNIKCKVFSLEMKATQLMNGFLTEAAQVDNQRFSLGDITDQEWSRIEGLRSRLVPYLEIDDKAAITIQYLESKVRKFVKQGGQLIAIDYLQLMKLTKEDARGKLREGEIAFLTGNIKRIAKEYNIPVIELSQLSRDVEKRAGDKRPQLSDLRESGAIEQDAEVIIFIQRPEADGIQELNDNPTAGIAKLILAKNRFGPCIDVKVAFTANITRYSPIETLPETVGVSYTQNEIDF